MNACKVYVSWLIFFSLYFVLLLLPLVHDEHWKLIRIEHKANSFAFVDLSVAGFAICRLPSIQLELAVTATPKKVPKFICHSVWKEVPDRKRRTFLCGARIIVGIE